MAGPGSARSIVAVDIGSTRSHGALIEPVEGVYRLIACCDTPSVGDPGVDLVESLQRCLARLEELAEQRLLAADGAPVAAQSHGGPDRLIVTTSAAPPLDCAVIGLTEALSLQSGLAVCGASHCAVRSAIALAQEPAARSHALQALRAQPPEVVILLGGVDGGPTALLLEAAAALAELFAAVEPQGRPAVILAGNPEARRPIAQTLGDGWDFDIVENVQPALGAIRGQELQRELAQRYASTKLPRLGGYGTLAAWASAPLLASDAGLGIILQFLSREGDATQRVLGLDWGASQVTAALAEQGLVWSRTSQGDATPPPSDGEPWALYGAAQQALAPALESLCAMGGQAPAAGWSVDLIAARGGPLAAAEGAPWATLALLDAVRPQGVARIALDWAAIWPQLGALAQVEPLAALQVLRHDALLEVATVIGLPGKGKAGARAGRLRLTPEGGETVTKEIAWGELRRLPLPEGASATVAFVPARGAGLAPLGPLRVHGGRLGVLVDARGRPLEATEMPSERIREWLGALA